MWDDFGRFTGLVQAVFAKHAYIWTSVAARCRQNLRRCGGSAVLRSDPLYTHVTAPYAEKQNAEATQKAQNQI